MAGYWDASRERFSDSVPKILGTNIALPNLELDPIEGGGWCISTFLQSDVRFSFFRKEITLGADESVEVFLGAWLADPERVLREHFKWEPQDMHKAKSKEEKMENELKALGL